MSIYPELATQNAIGYVPLIGNSLSTSAIHSRPNTTGETTSQ